MSQSDTKNLRNLVRGLDTTDIISIMESLHAAAASGQLKMTEASDPQAKQATIQAAIRLLEADRAKLDALLGAFKDLYSGTALSSSAPKIPNGSDDAAGVPPHANPAETVPGNTNGATEGASGQADAAAQAATGPVRAARAKYWLCDTCELWAKPTVEHRCTPDGLVEGCFNAFSAEELDIIHDGEDGWEEIDPPENHKKPSTDVQKPGGAEGNQGAAPISEQDEDDGQFLLRPHSKLERVYEAVKELIETNGPMHLVDMIQPLTKKQLFIGVRNVKSNLANFLSKLKARGLLASDNRGYWSLPEKEARP